MEHNKHSSPLTGELLYVEAQAKALLREYHLAPPKSTQRDQAIEKCLLFSNLIVNAVPPLARRDRELKGSGPDFGKIAAKLRETALPGGLKDDNNFPDKPENAFLRIQDELAELKELVQRKKLCRHCQAGDNKVVMAPWINEKRRVS